MLFRIVGQSIHSCFGDYNTRPLSRNDITNIINVWNENSVILNFHSSKTLFYFQPYLEGQYEDELYFPETVWTNFPEINMEDPNAYLYLKKYWPNVNYLHSKSEEYDVFEDFPFFEENIFNEQNFSVEETISDNDNFVKILNSPSDSLKPWLCFLLAGSSSCFENQELEISNTEFVNPYLNNSSPDDDNQNSFFQENTFDN